MSFPIRKIGMLEMPKIAMLSTDIFDKEKLLRAGFCIGIRAALSAVIVILLLKVHAGQSCPAVVIVEKNSLCIAA